MTDYQERERERVAASRQHTAPAAYPPIERFLILIRSSQVHPGGYECQGGVRHHKTYEMCADAKLPVTLALLGVLGFAMCPLTRLFRSLFLGCRCCQVCWRRCWNVGPDVFFV